MSRASLPPPPDLRAALAAVLERAARRWTPGPFAAFVVDTRTPLGAAVAEMVARLGCGLFHRSPVPAPEAASGPLVVGAAPLADAQVIASALASADRGLAAAGEPRETPGAAALHCALARARSSRVVLVVRRCSRRPARRTAPRRAAPSAA